MDQPYGIKFLFIRDASSMAMWPSQPLVCPVARLQLCILSLGKGKLAILGLGQTKWSLPPACQSQAPRTIFTVKRRRRHAAVGLSLAPYFRWTPQCVVHILCNCVYLTNFHVDSFDIFRTLNRKYSAIRTIYFRSIKTHKYSSSNQTGAGLEQSIEAPWVISWQEEKKKT